MQKKIIFRVDDRLIHGQVIEGWLKYYNIGTVIIVNDNVCKDPLQEAIFSSILPSHCKLYILDKTTFKNEFTKMELKDNALILLENVRDLYDLKEVIDKKIYINIGCIAKHIDKIKITDAVFLDKDELKMLIELREEYNIYIKKLPWDTNIEIKNFSSFLGSDK